MRELRKREIALAAAMAAGLHVAVAAMVLRAPLSEGTPGGGFGGVQVGLAGGGGGGAGGAVAIPAEAVDTLELPAEAASQMPPTAAPTETAPEPSPTELAHAAPVLAEITPDVAPEQPAREMDPVPETALEQAAEVPETLESAPTPIEPVQAEPIVAETTPVEPVETLTVETNSEPVVAANPKPEPEIVDAEEPPLTVAAVDPLAESTPPPDDMVLAAPVPQPKPPVPVREPEPEVQPETPASPPTAQPTRAAETETAQAESPAVEAHNQFDSWTQAALPSTSEPSAAPGGAGGAGSAGSATSAGVPGSGGAPAAPGSGADRHDFMAEVAAMLNRHKRYPRRARVRGAEGTGVLRFSMDRNGHVLSAQIDRSSGHAELDEAILEMVQRAQPLPAIPGELGVATLEFSVPISFALR